MFYFFIEVSEKSILKLWESLQDLPKDLFLAIFYTKTKSKLIAFRDNTYFYIFMIISP